jgi:hypothetical protein
LGIIAPSDDTRSGVARLDVFSPAKPLPIAQIRKTKPEVVTEIDALPDQYCDSEVAEVLNRQAPNLAE